MTNSSARIEKNVNGYRFQVEVNSKLIECKIYKKDSFVCVFWFESENNLMVFHELRKKLDKEGYGEKNFPFIPFERELTCLILNLSILINEE